MITLKNGTLRLIVNPLGGGIARFSRERCGKVTDFIYGYSSEEEKVGSMGDVLFPFPGRVKNCQYSFAGQDYTLSGLRIKDGHANHGFAKQAEWKVVGSAPTTGSVGVPTGSVGKRRSDEEVELEFEMRAEDYRNKGFPFSLRLTLTYTLNSDGFVCRAEVVNLGNTNAPFGLGFHPYFQVGQVNDSKLKLPAQRMVEFANLEPTGKLLPVAEAPFDTSGQEEIGNIEVDNCFTGLKFENGHAETILSRGNNKIKIWQDQSFPYLQIYSADTLSGPYKRKAIAIEPQTCTGFALNHPEMGLITLNPDEMFEASWGVSI